MPSGSDLLTDDNFDDDFEKKLELEENETSISKPKEFNSECITAGNLLMGDRQNKDVLELFAQNLLT